MPRRHTVLALVVAACWAVNFVVIDIGLESFPPLLFAALRFGLTAFPAILLVPRPDVRWLAVVAVGFFICVGQFGLLFVAMSAGLPAGLASVIAPLQPVFTIPLAAVALGERPTARQAEGVALAVVGIGAIASGRAHGVPLGAVALGIVSAASWGCGNVVTRAAGTTRPFSLLVWSSVVAPAPLLGLSLVFEGTARWHRAAYSINSSGLLALGYVVIVSTFFGYGVWYRLMSRHPVSTVAPFTLLIPVVGIVTAWVVRGEHPTWGELLGSLIVLVGLALALGLLDAFAARRRAEPDVERRPRSTAPRRAARVLPRRQSPIESVDGVRVMSFLHLRDVLACHQRYRHTTTELEGTMADELLATIEDADRTFAHQIDLLNQAIQDLDRYQEAARGYSERHPEHASTGHVIADSLKSLQDLLHSVIDQHNQVTAVLAEKKQEVLHYEPDSI